MVYDLRKGRLKVSEYDREFSVKVAKQNLQGKTVISLIVLFVMIVLTIAIILAV